MKRFPMIALGILVLFAFLHPASAQVAAEEMVEMGEAFLKSLKQDQKDKAMFPLKDEERFNWHFVPKDRKGLPLKDLTRMQRDALHGFLDSALSQRGFVKVTGIMSLEKVLYELENRNESRDADKYFISFFGEPAAEGTWAWRFEGHHLSVNMTIVNGKLIAGTPVFLGANPAELQEGPRKGFRALSAEEDLGRQLIKLLDDDQRREAIIADAAPKEILTGAKRKVEPLSPQGLPLADMNRDQSELLLKLVKEYIYLYRSEIADEDWRKIKDAGFEFIHFAWAGGIEKGEGHYYRIQGPTFLLEYDNVQNNANHVHTVWRDFNGDFGEDILLRHREETPHDK
jgi:hypothetical protein